MLTLNKLKSLTPILKIAQLCKRAKLNPVNIQQKISRGSDLSHKEAIELQNELNNVIEEMKE